MSAHPNESAAIPLAARIPPRIRATLLDLVQERLQVLRQMPANAGCVGHNGHTVTAAEMTAQMEEARQWLQGWRGEAR